MDRLIRELAAVLDHLLDRHETVGHLRETMRSRARLTAHAGHAVPDPAAPGSRFAHDRRRPAGRPTPFLRASLRQESGGVDRNAEARHLLLRAMDACGHGIITLDVQGRVEYRSTRAAGLIARHLSDARSRRDQLPERLERWVRQQEGVLATAPGISRPLATLVVGRRRRLLVHLFAGMTQRLLLLRERVDSAASLPLESSGLTRREAEVLTWVAQGKTNEEIGTILGLSRRTAEKHVEHILHKLGVENRTTAARAFTGAA